MKAFANGLLTGIVLQLAIGPVFFFIMNITLQKGMSDGLAAVLGVTIADYMYISLAILGVGKVLEGARVKKVFGVVSSFVLGVFGIMIVQSALSSTVSINAVANTTDLLSSFTSTFLLAASSPMGIVFFTSIFAAKAFEHNYAKRELVLFGLATGLTTLIFMSLAVLIFALVKSGIPEVVIQILNLLVGFVLVGYSVMRLVIVTKVFHIRNI